MGAWLSAAAAAAEQPSGCMKPIMHEHSHCSAPYSSMVDGESRHCTGNGADSDGNGDLVLAAVDEEVPAEAALTELVQRGMLLSPRKPNRKVLVLDLDETLIHATLQRPADGKFDFSVSVPAREFASKARRRGGVTGNGDSNVSVKNHVSTDVAARAATATAVDVNDHVEFFVHKRPHVDLFLRQVCEWFDVFVFTASLEQYAVPLVQRLLPDGVVLRGCFYRQQCTYVRVKDADTGSAVGGIFLKDLRRVLSDAGWRPHLGEIVVVDNSPHAYALNDDNAIPIADWRGDSEDDELLGILLVLDCLRGCKDVRSLLSLRNLVTAGR